MLGVHTIAGRDLLPHHYLGRGDAALVERVNELLHPLWSGDDDVAREQHRAFVERRLIRWRRGWPDLVEQIRAGSSDAAAWHWLLDDTGTALVITEQMSVGVLDQISYLIARYIALDPDQLIVETLWAAHTHIYDRFMCSPRLAVCGPMPNLGKTTQLDVLGRLVRRPWRAASQPYIRIPRAPALRC
jgi:hypothetical protein